MRIDALRAAKARIFRLGLHHVILLLLIAIGPLVLRQAAGASGGSLFGKMKTDQLTQAMTAVSVMMLKAVETRIVAETRCGATP